MKPEHVIAFLFAEMGTIGSVDGAGRLVIRGRFQQKQIENVLRRYMGMFYFCMYMFYNVYSPLLSRIRDLQNLQITRHSSYKREPNLLHGLRIMWEQAICQPDQDWLPGASGEENKEQDGLIPVYSNRAAVYMAGDLYLRLQISTARISDGQSLVFFKGGLASKRPAEDSNIADAFGKYSSTPKQTSLVMAF